MKENLKPRAYKLRKAYEEADRVLFVERSGELRMPAWITERTQGSAGRPSLKRAQVGMCKPETG